MTIQRYLLPFLAAAMLAAAQPRNSDAALGAARHLEEAEGNYPAAIEAYKRFLAQYGKDRALAAKALIRMGQCYEKLGDAESRKIYERVVREYADQKEAVAAARAKLGGDSAAKNAGIVMRQVWTGPKVDVYGTISPDGRYLSMVDWSTGDLALHDFKTSEDRHLTAKPKGVREHAEWSAISRDGKLVAYSWYKGGVVGEQTPQNARYDVRLANLHGDPNPRVLFDNEEVLEISPYDWSPDGKWLAVGVQRKDLPPRSPCFRLPAGRCAFSSPWIGEAPARCSSRPIARTWRTIFRAATPLSYAIFS
jgi:tetratricopeptide (TPR) repeat protein